MKLNFPLLKRCAFAVTLLSLTHFTCYAEDTEEQPLVIPQEELMATAENNVFTDTLFDSLSSDDLLLNNEEFASNLVAGNAKKNKQRRNKNRQSKTQQLDISQANTAWVPKFVWMGEVDNSEDLKCFATFLIGSMSDQNNNSSNNADFDSGVFMTPNANNTAQSDYNPSSSNSNFVARKSRSSGQHKGNNNRGKNSVTARGVPLPRARLSLDFHGGASFLYFTKYQGNLLLEPPTFFSETYSGDQSVPVKGRVRYDVTPLYEMDAIFNFVKWLGFGVYAQSNQGTVIRTKSLLSNTLSDGLSSNTRNWSEFKSTLDLNAVGGKLVFNFQNLVRFKTWCLGVYLGAGAGIGFQTWKDNTGSIVSEAGNARDASQFTSTWNTRYMTNLGYTGDVAISFKSRNPYTMMTRLKFGCKFIGWGHTSSLGKAQTPGHAIGYWKPISFQNIFAVVPYMGFSWSF